MMVLEVLDDVKLLNLMGSLNNKAHALTPKPSAISELESRHVFQGINLSLPFI